MRILWRRPLFCASVVSAFLAVFARRLPLWASVALVMLSATGTFLLAFFLKKHFSKVFVVFLCCLLSCFLLLSSTLYFGVVYSSCQKLVWRECKISGYVTDRRSRTDSFLLTVTELDGEKTRISAALDCFFSSGIQIGDHIDATVTGIPFDKSESYDEEATLLSEGVKILFSCEDPEALVREKEEAFHLLLLFRNWNNRLSMRLGKSVGGEEGDLAVALLLGNKSGLSSDTTLAFRRAGVSHLLALSGLHVSILIGALTLLLQKIFRRRLVRMAFLSVCLLFYLALTGFHASCLRATLMVLSIFLARLFWEEPDPLTSLGAALFGTLLLFPYAIGDLSLWMSYLATFGILTFSPAIRQLSERFSKKLPRIGKLVGKLLGALLVGFAANAAILLLTSLKFGEVSLTSIPATVVLSLPTTLTLISSILALIFPGLGFLPSFFARLMIDFVNLISDRPGVLPSTTSPLTIALAVGLTILLLALAILNIKRPLVFLSLPLALALVLTSAAVLQSRRNAELFCDHADLKIEDGVVYVLCKDSEAAGAAAELTTDLSTLGSTEIHHLYLQTYSAMQPRLLAKLSASIRVFCLHLPQARSDEELAVAIRLEQEATLHRIDVVYED